MPRNQLGFIMQKKVIGRKEEIFHDRSYGRRQERPTPCLHRCLGLVRPSRGETTQKLVRNLLWRGTDPETQQQAQVDLIIERADRMINLCEAKYSEKPYLLSKEEYEKYMRRVDLFKHQTRFSGGIIPTFITANGLQRNAYSEHITMQITMDDLFKEIE